MNTKAIADEIRAEIDRLQKVLKLLEGDSAPTSRDGSGKRKMSAEARAKIAAAQTKRWAKFRADQKKKA